MLGNTDGKVILEDKKDHRPDFPDRFAVML